MPEEKRKGRKAPIKNPLTAVGAELANQKTRIDEIRASVNQLKDILQVQDNWHSRVSKMIGEQVVIVLDVGDISGIVIRGKLLWTDRYNVGIDEPVGKEIIVNKGHLVTLRLA